MSEKELKLQFRLLAMEQIIRVLMADLLHRQSGGSVQAAKDMIQQLIDQAASDTTPEARPEQSDLIAGEYEDAIRDLLDGVATILESAAKKGS